LRSTGHHRQQSTCSRRGIEGSRHTQFEFADRPVDTATVRGPQKRKIALFKFDEQRGIS
jgi:hypothetical protein